MKSGENKKKLVLKKISIANLDKDKTNQVKGGLPIINGGILAAAPVQTCTCKTKDGPPCPCGLVCPRGYDYCLAFCELE